MNLQYPGVRVLKHSQAIEASGFLRIFLEADLFAVCCLQLKEIV